MTDTLETKLGEAKRVPRSRIWLQGSRLPEHGFGLGTRFQKIWSDGKLTLVAIAPMQAMKLPAASVGKVSGNSSRPVIDIVGKKVAETFSGSHVKARFEPRRIIITNL